MRLAKLQENYEVGVEMMGSMPPSMCEECPERQGRIAFWDPLQV